MIRRRRWLAVLSSLVVALPLTALQSASAATRTGVRISTGTTSAFPRALPPVVASGHWVIYQVVSIGPWPDQEWTTRALKVATGATKAVPIPRQVRPTIASDIVAGTNGVTNTVHWADLSAGTSGHRALHGISATDKKRAFLSASPDGWLSLVKDSSGVWHLFDTVAATGAATELSNWNRHGLSITNLLNTGVGAVATGPTGVVLNDGSRVVFVAFSDGTPTTLDTTGYFSFECFSASNNAAGCIGQDDTNSNQHVLRLSLAGGAPVVTGSNANFCFDQVQVTDTETGFRNFCKSSKLFVEPAAGGVSPVPVTGYDVGTAVSDATDFYFSTGPGSGKAPGLWKTPDATTAPVQLVSAGPSRLMDAVVALAPGRIAFSDTSTRHFPLFSRTLSTGGSVSLGAQQLIASHATNQGLSISGELTAYETAKNLFHQTLHVAGLGRNIALAPDTAMREVQLSGTHVLYWAGTKNSLGIGSPRLHDLRANTDVAVKGAMPSNPAAVALFGNYLALLKSDGTVWRRNLATGKTREVASPVPTGYTFGGGGVSIYGNYIGWDENFFKGGTGGHSYAYRNVRTMSKPVPIGGGVETTVLAGLTSDGAVVARHADGLPHYVLRRYGNGNIVDLTSDAGFAGVSVDESRLLWIDHTGVGRVASLPHVPDPPTYLGNGLARHSFTTGSGRRWTTYLPTSASLSSCHVIIRSGSTVVRRLACQAAGRRLGDGVISWDGRDGTGHLVPAGTYGWQFVAGNADGKLRLPAGNVGTVRGRVVVSHG